MNPPTWGAGVGKNFTLTRHLLNFGFIPRASRVIMRAPRPESKKIKRPGRFSREK
jgi:hypothetical protein